MSEERLQRKLKVGQGSVGGQPFGGRLLEGGIDQGLSLGWELCRNRSQGLHNLYTRSFSIIGVL